MTPPTERRPDIDATNSPSARSDVDETARTGASAAPTAGGGFGPPAVAGEVGTLGPYRVVKELGKGGMGAVYAAIDTRLDRRLALKVMLPQFAADPASRERFLREARAAARVKHDNVVTVYEADERNGVPYIAMEYLEGYPLDEYLKKKGNPTPSQVLKLAAETAAGLAAAHRQGLVHRDVKPGNLWLEAPSGRVKVLDFGLARPVDAEVELTKQGAVVGTPAYMSPEQARGEKVDHRTDLFSLGAVLYRLLTGRLPFQAPNTMAMLIALGTEDPPPVRSLNPAVPEPLADLIHQLLAKSADARPASAEEVLKRLRAMGSARSASAAPAVSQVVYVPIQVTVVPDANPFADLDATEAESAPAAAPAAVRQAPRRSWAVAAGLAALVAAVFGGVVIIIRNRDGSETKIEVADGATVTVKDKTGKTLATVGPGGKAAAVDNSPDRKAAEWVLSVGGVVKANGEPRDIRTAAELPKDRFNLSTVLLDGKEVSDAQLGVFRDCTGILYLGLDKTGVGNAGLAHVAGCRSLTTLFLGGTSVTDAGLGRLKNHPQLRSLNLRKTAVTDTGLTALKDTPGLTYLNLSETGVTDAGLVHVGACRGLSELLLYATGVTDTGLAHLKGCSGLTLLDLQGTKLTDAGLGHLKNHPQMKRLNLRKTAVTDAGLTGLADTPALITLNLSETQVTDAGLVHVGACRGLNSLGLQKTEVTGAGFAHLKDCTELTDFDLYGTKVTDAGLAHLKDCKGLQNLYVTGTKVTANGLADFHAAVPGCKIEHDGGVIEAIDVDRKAAEWVLLVGGSVQLAGRDQPIGGVADLPRDPFILSAVVLEGKAVEDVDLARLKHLKRLSILNIALTRVTDAGLADVALPELTNLSLTQTAVTGAGLVHLKACTKLDGLSIGGPKVTDAGLVHLAGHPTLRVLLLGHSQLVTDAGLDPLKACKGLASLDVRGTKVTAKGLADFHAAVPGCKIEHDGGVIEAIDVDRRAADWVLSVGGVVRVNGEKADIRAAADLPKGAFALTWADLWKNPKVTDDGLANFKGCKNLLGVIVGHAPEVTDRGLSNFRDSTRLTYLNLSQTKVTPAGLDHFRDCADLAYLDLYGTATTDAAVPAVVAHKNLTVLGLGSTKLTDAGLARLPELKKLTQLNLQDMGQVTDASLLHVKRLPALEHLALSHTSVTDAGVVHLKELRSLTMLGLTGTKVTAKGLADFRATVPGCRVEHDGGVIEPKK